MTTYGEQFESALAIETREEADAWLEQQAQQIMNENPRQFTTEEVKAMIRVNLGYMSGYYGIDTAQRVYELFDAVHPIFGTPAMQAKLTPEDAFAAGYEFGKALKAQEEEQDNA